ncbi:hypothetical protein Pmani_030230 [Petrolisthes manimaculis]|uniref:Uncharacterized protein n=1 Tax=Petrolisthes manimaculis TaxID=1843537 RepID=A0AAE1TW67_9EUCA|nr:hypothetical protein Pmani_030230 [Petrolisthes manimaculis]
MATGNTTGIKDIEEEVQSIIKNLINEKEDWSGEDKSRVQSQYMKEYSDVLREMVPFIKRLQDNRTSQTPHPHQEQQEVEGSKEDAEVQEEEKEDTSCESLEDIEIRYEATLIAVTQKRMKYPPIASALRGKTARLQKNTVEAMKVELPPRVPLVMGEGKERLDEHITCLADETLTSISQSSRSIQQHTLRHSNLAEATDVLINNRNHPTEAIMSYLNQDNKPESPYH